MRRVLYFFRIVWVLLFMVSQVHAATRGSPVEKASDVAINHAITKTYATNKQLSSLNIQVSVQNGVVTLTGYVKDKQAFVDALRYAMATKGVKSVNADNLDIKRVNTSFKDAYITAKIEAAVLKAKVFDDESIPLVGINATTSDGVVTLSGGLKHEKSIGAIIKRANEVHGVKKIISQLKVN